MDFWSQFSKTVAGAADHTVKSAEKLTDIAKLKYRLVLLNKKRDEAYRDVGHLRYAEDRGEGVTEEMYRGLFDQISDLNEKIAVCENKLNKLQDNVCCTQCGNRMKKGTNYCPKCGEKQRDI